MNIKNKALQLLKNYPSLYYLIYSTYYRAVINQSNSLYVVTSPGHVGSSTLFNSIKSSLDPKSTVLNIHSFREDYNNKNFEVPSISARHVIQSMLKAYLEQDKLSSKHLYVFTTVRDPVARALGSLFQNPSAYLNYIKNIESITSADYEETCKIIRSKMIQNDLKASLDWQLSYYVEELKEYYKFNILDAKLCSTEEASGICILKHPKRELYMLSIEQFERNFKRVIPEHLSISPIIKLANINENRINNNNGLYKYCKQNLKFPVKILNEIYSHPFWRTFYGDKKVSQFITKWSQ